jgi:DNA polymerase
MRAAAFRSLLSAQGVFLSLSGDRLQVDAPRGAVTPELRAKLLVAKPYLLAELRTRASAPVVVDFESRSLAKLEKVGARRYARHPSTAALCLVAKMPDGTLLEWRNGDAPPLKLFEAVALGHPLAAHNARFDEQIWKMLGWPPAVWVDTAQLAMLAGLPRKLDDVAEQVLGKKKDKAGRTLTLQLSRPGKDGKLRPITPEEMTRVVSYCRTDVELLAEVWSVRLGALRDVEADVRALDAAVNGRGFGFDRDLAQALIECETAATAELFTASEIAPATIRSPVKLIAALAQVGVNIPNIQEATLEPLLKDATLPAPARALLEARVASAGIASKKLQAALDRLDDDGRLRDTLNFHGAHTGRWTGVGFQPQNLPHGARKLDVNAAVKLVMARDHNGLRELARTLGANVRDVAAKLVRACIVASPGRLLAVGDYSSVEPRVLAWFICDEAMLKFIREGGDVYVPMAAKLFNVPLASFDPPMAEVAKQQRQWAKPVVLGCCYGMGAARLRTYAEGFGVDWSRMPVTPEQVVEMWRNANPLVAGARGNGQGRRGGLWQKLENAALRACCGERVTVGPTTWERAGKDVVCVLPSGRRMIYREALVEAVRTPWDAFSDALTYLRYEKGKVTRTKTYGGLFTENIIQAISRDVMVDAMLRLDQAGFALVLTVHDEIVAEVALASGFDAMKAIMEVPPVWAPDLLLAVEGYAEPRYRKG